MKIGILKRKFFWMANDKEQFPIGTIMFIYASDDDVYGWQKYIIKVPNYTDCWSVGDNTPSLEELFDVIDKPISKLLDY